ncbi:lysylphosphatidylglycerol synthase transmembrane domain-containing protein [Dictyobacter kobayashii]|uniref:Dolichol-P-glucose synthetase n=1 Tax=Dictyobacter kobayashii TaxID=2014872 RepID=A0A402ABX9_9CHLR|nr:lysylphosphatidylglycerol synthase transmembrane domain-containing protein [Dictyobacter kobayashii]GCE16600.1 hypothetical protein KDK_04000 [Dictyobacter kobayashii]
MSIPLPDKTMPPEENYQSTTPPELTAESPPPTSPPKQRSRWLKFGLRLSCALILLTFLFKAVSWPIVLQKLQHLDDGEVIIGLIIGLSGIIISSYQWQSLLDGEGIHIDLRRLINLYFIGIAFNHFLPTGMGGDVVKAYYAGKEGHNTAGSVSAVVMSRVTGFVGMLLVSIPALIIWHAAFTSWVIITFVLAAMGMCSALAVVFFAVTLLPQFIRGRWARYSIVTSMVNIGMTLRESLRHPRALWSAIAYGVLFHLSAALNYYAFAMLLHIQLPLPLFMVIVPLVSLIAVLPTTINGYGLRESAFITIFATLHVDTSTATALVLLADAQGIIFAFIGGAIYLFVHDKKGLRTEKAHLKRTASN